MPLGWCNACETLRAITKLPLGLGQARCDWAPVEHDAPDTHRGCGGVLEVVDDVTEDEIVDVWCTLCSLAVAPDDVVPGSRCPGSRRAIR